MRNFTITDLMISVPSAKNQQRPEASTDVDILHPGYYNADLLDAECQHTHPGCIEAKTSACNPCTQTSPGCVDAKTSACDPCTQTSPGCVDAKTSACDPCTQTSPGCVDATTSGCSPCTQTSPGKNKDFIELDDLEASTLLLELKSALADMAAAAAKPSPVF